MDRKSAARLALQDRQPLIWRRRCLAKQRGLDPVHVVAGGSPPRPEETGELAGGERVETPASPDGQCTPEHRDKMKEMIQ